VERLVGVHVMMENVLTGMNVPLLVLISIVLQLVVKTLYVPMASNVLMDSVTNLVVE
jgi:hypothetical protein